MEVKKGYKKTEVGVIPEEWEVRYLPEVTWFQEGPGLRQWQFTKSGLKVINVTNLENGFLNLESTDRYINHSECERIYKHFLIDVSDILMASSGNSYSKTAIVREQDLPLVMNTSVIRFKPNRTIVYSFLWVLLNSSIFKNQIDQMITGGAQPNFGPYHLKRVRLPIPSINEQRAIAEALSDVDALISSLDQLIDKKRDIKTAAMQELLTGKRRLPGFSGKWEEKRLGELAGIRSGGTPSTTQPRFWDGDIFWCTPTDITALNGHKYLTQTYFKITLQGLKSSSAEMIPAYSILMTSRATIGECAINTVDITSNQGFKNFIPSEEMDVEFLYYLLIIQKERFIKLCSGSTFLEINKTQLTVFEVRIPPTKDEQTAIAEVLSDMDTEIEDLEKRRDKTRLVKQGMMQELLTGRIRLV